MLDRLQAERAAGRRAVLRAQEAERTRIARDLHDEANQALTGVLLRLEATAQRAPQELRDELRETQGRDAGDGGAAAPGPRAAARRARRPRLAAALRTKVDDFGRRDRRDNEARLRAQELADLGPEEQIVVYRVVQESLSNVARHAGARKVSVDVERATGRTSSRA